MFIIFILLLWDCGNKLVLWLVSSWDDERRKDVVAGWSGTKMYARACCYAWPDGFTTLGAWADRCLSQYRQDMKSPWRSMHLCLLCFLPFPCRLWPRTTSAVVPCPQQLVCATGIPVWGGGRGSYLQLIYLLVSEVFWGQLAQKPKGCTFQKTSPSPQNTRVMLLARASSPQLPQHGPGLTLHPSPCQRSPYRGMACPNSLGLASPEGPVEPVKAAFVTGAQ